MRGSTLMAGGQVSIRAEGAGEDSDLIVSGSQIRAGGAARLKAEGDIELLAGQNTAGQHTSQSSQSGSIGVGLDFGAGRTGVTFNASASRSRGNADGSDVTWTYTLLSGASASFESGGDSTFKGAVLEGAQVSGKVGGNLHVESLQDISSYDSKQHGGGASISLCIPPLCEGPAAPASTLARPR